MWVNDMLFSDIFFTVITIAAKTWWTQGYESSNDTINGIISDQKG